MSSAIIGAVIAKDHKHNRPLFFKMTKLPSVMKIPALPIITVRSEAFSFRHPIDTSGLQCALSTIMARQTSILRYIGYG